MFALSASGATQKERVTWDLKERLLAKQDNVYTKIRKKRISTARFH
jgi:hypothetical protein